MPPSTPAGQPLSPGTVTAHNTWNQTQSCPAGPAISQPLGPLSSWNASLSIPTQLFMGKPDGTYIDQSYHVSPNGTFSVSDDHGNSFSLTVPSLLPGVSETTLVGNSTTAVLEIRIATASLTLADTKLTFSVYDQFCRPAGVRLVITGSADWGQTGRGVVALAFQKKPISLSGDRAYFGNSSGVALGFDWNDSQSLNPTFDATSSVLSYPVGPSFSIDPVTVGTVANPQDVSYGYQGRILYGNGYYWLFYLDVPSNSYVYRSSSDGLTWSAATAVSTSGLKAVGGESVFVSGTTVYFATVSARTSRYLYYNTGTLGSGAITWGTEQSVAVANYPSGTESAVDIAADSNGKVWIVYLGCTYSNCGSGTQMQQQVYTNQGGSWAQSLASRDEGFEGQGAGQLVPLTLGKMAFIYNPTTSALPEAVDIQEWSGSSWSAPVATSGKGYDTVSSFTHIGDTVVGVLDSSSFLDSVYFEEFPYGSTAWYQTTLTTSGLDGGISTDGTSLISVFYWTSYCSLRYTTSSNLGSSWSAVETLTSPGKYDLTSSAVDPAYASGGLVSMVWGAGSSSPYDLEFAAIPDPVPTAATSSKPWSRAGLSPYESYFSEFSDYVSPGNGLVAVEAGTFDLPGRGLSFAPTLVYSEPYAFRSSGSPYLYDNYTGASLGYGWSLNLPWMGANYLHLADGQAYPYSWSGNTFQYNGVTNFVLTANSGGTYTLTMPSGTVYQFDSSRRLASITDRTGNNVFTFSYGANGYVSQVTDTVGRTISFTYNSNNQLVSITSGTRTWTLGYTGNLLTSLTDPLSRVTTFQYAGTTGADAWLLSAVDWPTGGRVTYTYGSAPVGTEVSTYYATARDVYYDSTHLSQSQSISYTIVNGQVTWSNTTLSDGTTVRSYLDINFQSSKNLMKTYEKDGSGVLQGVTETDSDAAGRTNATKIYSPSGALLAESTFAYDDWGNLVYSKDSLGQQEWSSYANTDSSNSFGSSGCSVSFYTQTISSSIHDLLVGSCDCQNGSGSPQQQTYYEYDGYGNLLEVKVSHSGGWLYTDYTYDQYGNQLTAKNANGAITYSRYSSTYGSAYLTKNTVMDGSQNITTTYAYDFVTGNLLSQTDPNGQTTSYQYDALGRTTQVTYPAVNGVSAVTKYSYDGTNNILTTTDPDGHVTKAYFDGLARQTEVQQMNGTTIYSTVYYTYNWLDQVATKNTAAGNTYTYSYDWNGRLVKLTYPDGTYETTSYNLAANTKTVTDEDGHQTIYAYNRNQLLTSVKEYNSSSTYYLTTYSYDLSGNVLSVTDARGQTTSYQYDDLNRLVKTTFPDGTYETKTYDGVGNLLTRTTANGSTISCSYDPLNRLVGVSYPGSGGSVTYTYDADGNRLSQISPSAKDYYTYDARGQLTNQTEYVDGQKIQTLYAYDNASNVAQITYPDGYVLSMGYDGVGRLSSVGHFANITYTLDGQISRITYGNGEVQTYAYDGRDRPTQVKDVYGSTVEMALNYTYDGTGNVLTENSQTYGYDALNRLNYTSGPWGTMSYAYDSVGNRVQMVNRSNITDYSYGPFNRLLSAGNVNYTYDANGNMVTKSGGWTYSYDYENRLSSVSRNGVVVQQNFYDGDGNRVEQVAGESTTLYSYQGMNILYQKNLTSDTVMKSFYAGGIQVAQMVNYTTYYLHQDALGSTRLVMPASMFSSFSSNYVPYGMNYAMMGEELFQYTGKLLDEATGLYYEGARYYDPSTGRFVTGDSVVGSTSDPQSLNRYVYARDNPMKIVDMNGHEWWNPVADLTTAASDVVGAATDVANAASNAWNSLPPAITNTVTTAGVDLAVQASDAAGEVARAVSNPEVQATVAAVAITVAAGVAIVATGGTATPWALGAALGADSSLVAGLAQGKATLGTVLTSAAIGGVSGGLGAGAGVLTTAAIGATGTFADQQATSVVTTGHLAAITPQSMFGVAAGAVIGAYSGQIASSVVGSSTGLSTDLQSGIISASISTVTTFTLSTYTPTPMIVRDPRLSSLWL